MVASFGPIGFEQDSGPKEKRSGEYGSKYTHPYLDRSIAKESRGDCRNHNDEQRENAERTPGCSPDHIGIHICPLQILAGDGIQRPEHANLCCAP